LVTGAALLYCVVAQVGGGAPFSSFIPQMLAAGAGLLLLVGLWTPVVGSLVAVVETWMGLFGGGQPSQAMLLATLGATLAMIGPGAWSIDARLFGRKHLETYTK